MEPADDFEHQLFANLTAPPEFRETELRARSPYFRSLGWFWVAAHLVDDACGTVEELRLDTREQLRALISMPDGGLHSWPYSRVRNGPWSDAPGFRDVMILGDGAAGTLMVEVTDHQHSWLIARAGEHMPDVAHFPISYVEPGEYQPVFCLADELLAREEAYTVAQCWLRRGRIPAGFEYRNPYPQPGLS